MAHCDFYFFAVYKHTYLLYLLTYVPCSCGICLLIGRSLCRKIGKTSPRQFVAGFIKNVVNMSDLKVVSHQYNKRDVQL